MRDALVAQASRFLLHERVRDAPIVEQRLFLASKGLGEDEIQAAISSAAGARPHLELRSSRAPSAAAAAAGASLGSDDAGPQHCGGLDPGREKARNKLSYLF
mmetsp:Transcript_163548/g.524398  ORF Transcript_163548/g.524398 Transcript_163548/m.524398 type:complete len:102 (-) Transcript_163548:200-505(-)